MPVYEYECGDCNHAFEHFHRSSSEKAPSTCPSCGGRKVIRKLSVFSSQQSTPGPCPLPERGACSQCCQAGGTCPL